MANWSPDRQQAVQALWSAAEGEQVCCGHGRQVGEFEQECCGDPDYIIRVNQVDALAALDEIDRLVSLGLSSVDALSSLIVQRVAELPDRTSPDDWPEAMLVTSAELRAIVIDVIAHARQDLPDALAEIARQQADLTRLAEVGKADRDRAERLLSALDWAGDISEWNCDGSWTARKDWRTVILDALFPTDAKEARQ